MATKLQNSQTITVTPLHPCIGAEIGGVDVSKELDDAALGLIKRAWADHTMLLFRDQDVPEEAQLRFADNFGPIATRVTPPPGTDRPRGPDWTNLMMVTDHIDKDGEPQGSLGHGDMWFHTDKCYRERPHRFSFLYGIEIPSQGGHTKFASLYAAYNNMPGALKRRLADSFVMQGYDYGNTRRVDPNVNLEDILHFRQPIIVTNPDSGRRALYIARLNTLWIEGADLNESEATLDQLFALTEDPAICYEHVWRPGDFVMWDNLACLHARTDWPEGENRLLRRCTVEGDRLWEE